MWHEARRNERKIKGMMVDYKKRAERRKDFYEKIRRDPVEFLQVHGSRMKINIDVSTDLMAEKSLVPWRGDDSNMIDRFDVRAHLDVIPSSLEESNGDAESDDRVNYERWKTLIINDFIDLSEERALQLIDLQERHGEIKRDNLYQDQKDLKKKLALSKTAIGYSYDNTNQQNQVSHSQNNSSSEESEPEVEELNIDLESLNSDQVLEINSLANRFGIKNDNFMKFLNDDKLEVDRIKAAKGVEQEKSMFSGRKARRERRNFNQKRSVIVRTVAPVEVDQQKTAEHGENDTSSDSDTHFNSKTEFITSFGGSSDEETCSPKKELPVGKLNEKSKDSRKAYQFPKSAFQILDSQPTVTSRTFKNRSSFIPKDSNRRRQRSRSKESNDSSHDRRSRSVRQSRHRDRRSRSRSRSRTHRRREKSRYRSRSNERRRTSGRERRRSRSDERVRSRDRSRSRSRERHPIKMRSRSKERERRYRSRSKSVDEFGRKKDLRKPPSPECEKVGLVEPILINIPPPPIKKYYRPELDAGSDSEEEIKAELKSAM